MASQRASTSAKSKSKIKGLDPDLIAAMNQDADKPPSESSLEAVRDKIRELRDLEFSNMNYEQQIKDNNEKIYELKHKTIVDMFDELKITNLGVNADGNLPQYDIKLKPHYYARLPDPEKDDEKDLFNKAIEWFKKHKHEDLLKTTFTISFGLREGKGMKAFTALLKKAKVQYSVKFGIPWNTLESWLREQVEGKKPLPPLELIKGEVGRVAKVQNQKKERV